ncbi:hypothetical protein [Saccharothrix lopnurensis]|uniref:Uncharacterized protein n=1 Tax=Saccharothrix lopnurensis TaxID=1670621 RepID=A0ABW1P804_9PSEU
MWTSIDYQLDWPAELLRGELIALRDHPYQPASSNQLQRLLLEAFHTDRPAVDYDRFTSAAEWADDPGPGRQWVEDLLVNIYQLRPFTPRRPYWTARRAGTTELNAVPLSQRFAELVSRLRSDGYLAEHFAEPCVDEDRPPADLNAELLARLGITEQEQLWPLCPDTWDTDTFYSLIEVFHDLVTRPRVAWEHDHGDCGLHFEFFDTDAGHRIYRALVNRLLAEHHSDLRLADMGEDAGRLVHVTDEARSELVDRVLDTPNQDVRSLVEHAIARFRHRDAGAEDKRSAVVTLAGALEAVLPVIKQGPLLSRKDESDLFNIANNFALRHQDIKQRRDYDPVFLDWIFWWYLATVELANRLLARATPADEAGSS